MYIESERKIDLDDLLSGEKIFKCKKDIKCENGTYKKGSTVYLLNLWDSNAKTTKLKIFDVDNWTESEGFNIVCCKSDYCAEVISVGNFDEYFELNQKASLKLEEINTEEQRYTDSWVRFVSKRDFYIKSALVIWLLTLFFLMIFHSSSAFSVVFYCLAAVVGICLIIGAIFHVIAESIYHKRGRIYSQRRSEVIEAAYK